MALRYILSGFMQPTFWMFGLNFASPSGSRRAFRRQPSYLPRTMADLFADQEPAETAVSPPDDTAPLADRLRPRSEEHTSELQSLMRNSYAVFCLQKNKETTSTHQIAP